MSSPSKSLLLTLFQFHSLSLTHASCLSFCGSMHIKGAFLFVGMQGVGWIAALFLFKFETVCHG